MGGQRGAVSLLYVAEPCKGDCTLGLSASGLSSGRRASLGGARTAPNESHAVVVLGVPWDFRLVDYPLDGATGEHIVPGQVLNLFERAVWSV